MNIYYFLHYFVLLFSDFKKACVNPMTLGRFREIKHRENCQMVCKPGSVPLLPALATIHLERLLPAASSNLPGHNAGPHLNEQAVPMSLYGFAPDGVYHTRSVARPAVRSYRTISPLP